MKRAKLLLKASRTMIGEGNHIALVVFTALVWGVLVAAMFTTTVAIIAYKENPENWESMGILVIQLSSMIIAYGLGRSFYTGFIEVKKESGKSSFSKFAVQLPVTKEDIIKAQFLDLLRCAFPGFLIVNYTIILATIVGIDQIMTRYIGILILFFIIMFLIICLDKGIFTSIFISAKIREFTYITLALISALIGIMPRDLKQNIHQYLGFTTESGNLNATYYLTLGLEFLGGLGGLLSLCIAGVIGYYLCCYLPIKISSLRGGSK